MNVKCLLIGVERAIGCIYSVTAVRFGCNFLFLPSSPLPNHFGDLFFRKRHGLKSHRVFPLRWRHNGRGNISNHQPRGCLLNRLFRRRSKKTPKLRVTSLCAGNSPGTGEFPAQMASNAEIVSIWWRHHDLGQLNMGSGDVCLPSDNKPLLEPRLTKFDDVNIVSRCSQLCVYWMLAPFCARTSADVVMSWAAMCNLMRPGWYKTPRHIFP